MSSFLSLLCAAAVALALVPSAAWAGKIVRFDGGGWGHGIGMSQYGAYGRARNGRKAAGIVSHYYSGASIAQASMPNRVRVGLLQYRSSIQVRRSSLSSGKVAFKVKGSSSYIATGWGANWEVRPRSTGRMKLWKNGKVVGTFGSPSRPLLFVYQAFGSMAVVKNTGRRYAYGTLEFGTYKSGSCSVGYCSRLVLSLPMEKYIYGLGEMPSSWHSEALKVQALAGRTYAYRRIKTSGQHRVGCDCALYDSPIDQAYVGDAKRDADSDGNPDTYWPKWTGAVDATAGRIIAYGGKAIQALYSSSSGGHTEHNENVWGGSALPYLRGVPDRPDSIAANPNHRWTLEMSWRTLASRLNSAYGTGRLKRFEIVGPVGVSGRVTVVRPNGTGGVRIVGSNRTARVSGWSVRSALSLKDTLFSVRIVYTIGWRFRPKHRALSGAPGRPTTDVYAVPRRSSKRLGQAQNFQVGRMTWRKATNKVVWQHGPVLRKYNRMGRERSVLGMPVSDVYGGAFKAARYVRGMIVWSSRTGARPVVKGFARAYRRNGGPRGPLRLPTTGRHRARTLPNGGTRQRFQRGSIYRNPYSRRVHALWGKIAARYRRIGEARSRCGYPVADMERSGSRAVARFQNGRIVLTSSGAVRVRCG